MSRSLRSIKRPLVLPILALAGLSLAAVTGREPVVGAPCEGCELVFAGMPSDPPSVARIDTAGHPGEPLRIEGQVTGPDGSPAGGIVVYAYQTDAGGVYPRGATRHGALRGWARTDAQGRYAFESIRPGSYPDSEAPQHVHMHIIEPGRCTYYIDDVMFEDDPYLTAPHRARATRRGGPGIAAPVKDAGGTWVAVRDIQLGQDVPGYARCGAGAD